MQVQNTTALPARELDRVERAFAEVGLLADRPARERAREAVAEAVVVPAASGEGTQQALLQLARALLDCAPASLRTDAARTARLIDCLAVELGLSRTLVAKALLSEQEGDRAGPADSAAEVLVALLESGDKRLTRLGFDLHDGPMQELLLLGEDLRMFRAQLASVLGKRREGRLLDGRLDDLEARLIALESGLRRTSTAVHVGSTSERPFDEAIAELAEAFAARTGIVPAVRLDGDLSSISASQRIALLSVVGEALNNIREHSRSASEVEVAIGLAPDGVGARVRDDGCGFDVEAALLDAAQRGRIGLAGIHERVRLLDGECVVDSRPGGPTTVSLKLPRWEHPGGSAQIV